MKIGILGSGMVGQTLAAGFLKHGHRAMLGTRDTDKGNLQDWRTKNPTAQVGTFEEAAKFGDLMVLCSLGRAAVEVLSSCVDTIYAGGYAHVFEEERERDASFSIWFDAGGGGVMGASASSAGGSGHGARENAV